MKGCYGFGYGNWELTITEADPATRQTQLGATHSGKFYFKGEYFAEYVNLVAERPQREGETREWAELFDVSLSDQDVRDFEGLERVADDLCQHLNEGCSVESWCRRQGLEPVRALKQSL
jgi:hypothetical protein